VEKEVIRKIKDANSIIDVACDLGMDIKNNMTQCIYPERHNNNDKHPSLYFNPKNNTFRCMVCPDVSGDVITLLQLKARMTFTESIHYLAKRAGIDIDNNNLTDDITLKTKLFSSKKDNKYDYKKQVDIYNKFLECCSPLEEDYFQWLYNRGISKQTINQTNIKCAKNSKFILSALKSTFTTDRLLQSGLLNKKGNLFCEYHEIIIPYYKDGILCYFQGRTIAKDFKPKEMNISKPIPCPFNIDILRTKPDIIIICEGVIDTLTLVEHNYPAIGVIGVKGFKKEWFKLLNNCNVKVAFDADLAGQQTAIELVQDLHKWGIKAEKINLPAGYDINRFFKVISQLNGKCVK